MNKLLLCRIIAVVAGAATLFGLQQGWGLQLYIAIPLAAIVYLAVKVGLGLLLRADELA